MSTTNQADEKERAFASFEGNEKTVLIVEDDRTHRALMKKILHGCGLKIITAENGHVALSKVKEDNKIDLIIMDWDMPGINGLQTVRKIRELEAENIIPHMPVIAFTSHCRTGDREQCLAAGMDAYLSKDVWMPKWRTTLIDNLQGVIAGVFEKSDFDNMGAGDESSDSGPAGDAEEFDKAAFAEAAALMKEDLELTIKDYKQDAGTYIETIKKGLFENNPDKIARASHPLKSNSHGFGLLRVSRLSKEINTLALESEGTIISLMEIRTLAEQLESAFQSALLFLDEELEKLGR